MIGRKISHYEVTATLGTGGMGEVYRGRDTKLGRDVAIKTLPSRFAGDPERITRLQREARTLATLQHPNVASIYGLEEVGEDLFLVMELIEGEDLAHRLSHGPLPVDEALGVARQIAEGLEAAHARGIVHRDLKPANVKVTPDGQVKILDFGLARAVQDPEPAYHDLADSPTIVASPSRHGVILGTAAYMSPEQARGKRVDWRSDIWAFGCVLYEMVTGTLAFPGETASDTLAAVLHHEPDWNRLPDALPRRICRLLRQCLTRDVKNRLQAIGDARLALQECLSPADGRFDEVPSIQAGKRSARRRMVTILAAVLGWLLALALLGKITLDSPAPREAVRLNTLTYSGHDRTPSASPAGDVVAFVSDRDGVDRIWLKQIAGGGEEPLTKGNDYLPRFSPDGSQILFVRESGGEWDLYRKSVLGGQLRRILSNVLEGDWSPDGSKVAFLRMEPRGQANRTLVGIADVQTGDERILTHIDDRQCYGIRWSPDGRYIAVNETSLSGMVAAQCVIDLIDVTAGHLETLQVGNLGGAHTPVQWAPDAESFVVGQGADVLTEVANAPSQVILYDLQSGECESLFWAVLQLPWGERAYSTLAVLNDSQIVLDEQRVQQHLYEVSCSGTVGQKPRRALTVGLGRDRQPASSPRGDLILFSSNRSGNVDLWIVSRATGELRQLTDDPANDWDPEFSPDGRRIIWSSDRNGNMEIWMAAADGSQARQVTQDGVDAENPTMTPDGQWIVYASGNDEKQGIWKIRPDGTDATQLAAGTYVLPDVSPDGRFAAFVHWRAASSMIRVLEIATGAITPFEIESLTNLALSNVGFGRTRWMPDGQAVIYVGADEQGRTGIFMQDFRPDADTSASRRPIAGCCTEYATESLEVTPDGQTLIISAMYDLRSLKLAEHVRLEPWE